MGPWGVNCLVEKLKKPKVWIECGNVWMNKSGKAILININDVLFSIYVNDLKDVLDGVLRDCGISRLEDVPNGVEAPPA